MILMMKYDLQKILYLVFKGKWIIVSVTAFFQLLAVIYSLSLPNIYESQALLVPVESSSGISGALRAIVVLQVLLG